MTTDAQQSPPGDPPPPEKENVFSRIAGVLFAPAETFASIARRPDILGPLLVLVIFGFISAAIVAPRMDFESMIQMQGEQMRKQNPNMSEEQLEQIEKFTRAMGKVGMWASPIIMIAWYAIVAGALLLAFRLLGGEGTYKQAFSATLYAFMPLLLFGIITTIVVLARGTFDPMYAATLVKSNPAFLVDLKEQPVLFSLLSTFDVFTIWTVVLLIFGFSAVSKTSRAKAAAIVITLWLAMILVKTGFAAMGAARMKG